MRVLLADPPWMFLEGKGLTRQVQPLGIASVGAFIANEHDVRFMLPDTWAWEGDDPWTALADTLASEAPDVLGLTAVTASFPAAAKLAAVAKEQNPELVTVLGGVHASSDPFGALAAAPAIDVVVRGEGEQTMKELLAALERAGGKASDLSSIDLHAIPGLLWRDGSETAHSGIRPPIEDLDDLPWPMRENLVYTEDLHPAFYQAAITLRGCPYQCIYCAVPSQNERKTRYRSPENVVDEIAVLKETYGIDNLFFHDSVFTMHRKRTVEICELMIERGLTLPFQIQTRVERVDPELLDLMKEAGLQQVFFGIESGDVTTLEKLKKKVSLETITNAVDMVKERDIRVTGFFMVGFPWETAELIEKTADFATGIGLEAVSLFSATPLPGTELWEMTGGAAALPDSIDFRKPQVNLTSMSDEEYAEVYARASARIESYNREQMMKQASAMMAGHAGMDGADMASEMGERLARVNWLEVEA